MDFSVASLARSASVSARKMLLTLPLMAMVACAGGDDDGSGTPTGTPTGTPGATNTPRATPAVTHTPAVTETPGSTDTPGSSPAPTGTPGLTPGPTRTPGPTSTPGPTPSPTPMEPPYGLETREANLTCKVEGSPSPPPAMNITPAFPKLSFTKPVLLTHPGDGSSRLFVVEQTGQIKVFDNDPDAASADVFLDLTGQVNVCCSETGLLGLAFHPHYQDNGYFYVNYVGVNPIRTVISRFQVDPTNPRKALAGSEIKLLEIAQPFSNHNGGNLLFDRQGYLYIGMGDGGSGGDPYGNGQNTKVLLGKMLRIDVDHPSGELKYGIPADNPFARATDGSRAEIYAWGLRNPWRWSFDRVTGQLWLGDVGQEAWEEIDLIEKGRNYGWNVMEGTHCYYPASGCKTDGLTLPILDYSHSIGKAVTGGFVYRGTKLPQLYGRYVYADYQVGQIWALSYDGSKVVSNTLLIDTTEYVSSFGEDAAGELYVLGLTSGKIYSLTPNEGQTSSAKFPTKLSDTGCFADLVARQPAAGVYGYAVNSPLWADDTLKERWLALPGTDQIGFSDTDPWTFPEGTIALKDFYLEDEVGNPSTRRLLETRLLVHQGDTWNGYVYKWNEEQSEAYLLEGSLTETYTVTGSDGAQTPLTHYYPSRADCQSCHTAAAGNVLGVRTGQLNRDFDYGGVVDNQLRSFDHIDLFSEPVVGPYDGYNRYPDPADESEPIESRARSYLYANCAHCHLPGGGASSTMDLRYEVPLAGTKTCNVVPSQGDMGIEGALLIAPGDPEGSIVSVRMHVLSDGRMPPIASYVVDELGTSVVDGWIGELAGCP